MQNINYRCDWIKTNIGIAVILKWKLRRWSVRLKWQKRTQQPATIHNYECATWMMCCWIRISVVFFLLNCRLVTVERKRAPDVDEWIKRIVEIFSKKKENFKAMLIEWIWTFIRFWNFCRRFRMEQLDYVCRGCLTSNKQLFFLILIILLIEIEFSPHKMILFVMRSRKVPHECF